MTCMKEKKPASKRPTKPSYPSRQNIKYVGVPKSYRDALRIYAAKHSDPDQKKSVSWACRVAIRRLMDQEGIAIATAPDDEDE